MDPTPKILIVDDDTVVAASVKAVLSRREYDITITNDAPSAGNDLYETYEDVSLNISAPGILANDSDQDGETLLVETVDGQRVANGTSVDGAYGRPDRARRRPPRAAKPRRASGTVPQR